MHEFCCKPKVKYNAERQRLKIMLLTMRDKEGNSMFLDYLGGKTLFKQRWQFASSKSTRNQQYASLSLTHVPKSLVRYRRIEN
jgi:hypothetical protein